MNTQKNKINKEINKQNYNQTNTKNKKKIYIYILNIRKDSKTQAPSPKLRSHQLQSPQLQAQPLPTTPGGKGEEGSRERRVESGGHTPKPPEQTPALGGRQVCQNSPKIGKFKFPRVFYIFFTFFNHIACKDAKIHQKLEKSNFRRIFLHFFYMFFIFFLQGTEFFQILVNFRTLQAK